MEDDVQRKDCRGLFDNAIMIYIQYFYQEGLYMAKLEQSINGDFDEILWKIVDGILKGSKSASLEASSDFCDGGARCSVRVFERYSYAGSNRVSMSVTLFQVRGGVIHLSAVTSGGSQALFFKINTWGEETFLNKLRELL